MQKRTNNSHCPLVYQLPMQKASRSIEKSNDKIANFKVRLILQNKIINIIIGRVLRLRRNTHWQQNASFDSLFSRAGLGHVGKGCIVRGTTTRRLHYWANGLFYPSWNRFYYRPVIRKNFRFIALLAVMHCIWRVTHFLGIGSFLLYPKSI